MKESQNKMSYLLCHAHVELTFLKQPFLPIRFRLQRDRFLTCRENVEQILKTRFRKKLKEGQGAMEASLVMFSGPRLPKLGWWYGSRASSLRLTSKPLRRKTETSFVAHLSNCVVYNSRILPVCQ